MEMVGKVKKEERASLVVAYLGRAWVKAEAKA